VAPAIAARRPVSIGRLAASAVALLTWWEHYPQRRLACKRTQESPARGLNLGRHTVMRQKVLFVSHDLVPAGGGSLVTCWALQALASAYDVTAIAWERPDFGVLDRMFGTSLARARFEIVTPSAAEKWAVDSIPDNSLHQRANYLLRMAKRRAHAFAASVASGFESDLGRRGIQYVNYPYISQRSQPWTVAGDAPLAARVRAVLGGRLPLWMLISGYSFERMRSNLTLTNSRWSRGVMNAAGIPCEVLYPPAPGDFAGTAWDERRDAFACVGRMVPEKRQDWVADTLALVRREWPALELHICGPASDARFVERLEAEARAHGPWVHIHRGLPRRDLVAVLANCRYGIHAELNEHFGIAPAEMARAGCIPFVHASGGQVEIVDDDPRLCYATAEDAAAKILAVLRDRGMQDELRSTVRARSERFAPEAFVAGFLDRVAKFLVEQGRAELR
jgi:glycosyltransferase involved in cell wall biosynthesis